MLRLSDLAYEIWLEDGDEIHRSQRLLGHRLVAQLGIDPKRLSQVLALYPGAVASFLVVGGA